MGLAIVHSRALDGLRASAVQVEVQLANGLPSFTLVGLADTEVKEARERVRAALQHSGFSFPHNRRITVNLAPAELPKEGGRFDLPIALGVLAADGLLCPGRLSASEFAGELSLAGELRPVRGALALALSMQADAVPRRLVLPMASARTAARLPGLDVRGAHTLAEVAASLVPGDAAAELPAAPPWPEGLGAGPAAADLRDVRGQAAAKRALEVAAAGGHSLLLVGPPGTGKSMLAQRLNGLLPPLPADLALAGAALRGLRETDPPPLPSADGGRPWRAPHHTASAVALVGGGSPPRPGEISLAHGGVLFLDELPEFPRAALEALREPLETGGVTVSRAARQAHFPARFQLVAAMNPCPCGWFGVPSASGRECRCPPQAVTRYQGRLSGPLLERIDLQVELQPAPAAALLAAPDGEASAAVAARVADAHRRQLQRQGVPNAQLDGAALHAHAALDAPASAFLRQAAERLRWSGRRLHRCLKTARTVADLAGAERIAVAHLAEALQWQRALAV